MLERVFEKKDEKERFQCSWNSEFNELTWISHSEQDAASPFKVDRWAKWNSPLIQKKVWKDKCFEREGISLALIIALINRKFLLEHERLALL